MRDNVGTAIKGTIVINDTTEISERFSALYIASDAVFSSIEVNENDDDVKDDYITTSSTAVPSGVLITPLDKVGHRFFSSVQLTSGTVIGIK